MTPGEEMPEPQPTEEEECTRATQETPADSHPPPFPEFNRPVDTLRKAKDDPSQYCITLLGASGATQQIDVQKTDLVAILYPNPVDPSTFRSITVNGEELDGAATFFDQHVRDGVTLVLTDEVSTPVLMRSTLE